MTTPAEGVDGVLLVAEESQDPFHSAILSLHDDGRVELRKKQAPEEVLEILRLEGMSGVRIKTRWGAINDVFVTLPSGERRFGFFKKREAVRFHALLAERLRGGA